MLSKSETGEYGTDLLLVRSKILPFSGEPGVESVPTNIKKYLIKLKIQ